MKEQWIKEKKELLEKIIELHKKIEELLDDQIFLLKEAISARQRCAEAEKTMNEIMGLPNCSDCGMICEKRPGPGGWVRFNCKDYRKDIG